MSTIVKLVPLLCTKRYVIGSCGCENSGGCHAIVIHVALCDVTARECGGEGAPNTLLSLLIMEVLTKSIDDGREDP